MIVLCSKNASEQSEKQNCGLFVLSVTQLPGFSLGLPHSLTHWRSRLRLRHWIVPYTIIRLLQFQLNQCKKKYPAYQSHFQTRPDLLSLYQSITQDQIHKMWKELFALSFCLGLNSSNLSEHNRVFRRGNECCYKFYLPSINIISRIMIIILYYIILYYYINA